MTDLCDYQTDDIAKIEAALEAARKVLYVLPTGGGKTVVATNIIQSASEAGKRVLVLTHRREILKQTSFKIPLDHGLIQAGLNINLSYPIRSPACKPLGEVHAHGQGAAACRRFNRRRRGAAPCRSNLALDLGSLSQRTPLGLTATPCRSDGRGLGNFFDTIIEGPRSRS